MDFVTILVLLAFSLNRTLSEEYDYDAMPLEPAEGRPVPEDLQFLYSTNKTDEELEMEDCMSSYTECLGIRNLGRVCALFITTHDKNTFETICEIMYMNCRAGDRLWEYFHDGPCDKKKPYRNGK